MERLTPEQIRLLEELRELRDAGILTIDEFEFQVAKVLGRPLVVEPLPADEELSAPEDTPVAELLEYEFVEPETSDEDEILAEENQVIEPPTTSDISASPIADIGSQQNKSGRRKVLIGTTAGLIAIVVIALVALGGGKSDSTSSQIIDSTTIVTQSTVAGSTDAPTSLGNTQAPATSLQSVAITTTVPQNASTGSAGRSTTTTPTTTTPITTPITTTVADSDSRRPIVTSLQISKSPSVFYDWPPELQQTVTFTATILNDEQLTTYFQGSENLGLAGDVRLCWKDSCTMKWFSRVQPGTWRATVQTHEETAYSNWHGGLNEMCVRIQSLSTCNGPSVSYEVLEQERNPPVISQLTMTPAVVAVGDTVSISVRLVDPTGVRSVRGSLSVPGFLGDCGGGDLSLSSGNEKDGLWSIDCIVSTPPGQGRIVIVAWGIYSDESSSEISFEVL